MDKWAWSLLPKRTTYVINPEELTLLPESTPGIDYNLGTLRQRIGGTNSTATMTQTVLGDVKNGRILTVGDVDLLAPFTITCGFSYDPTSRVFTPQQTYQLMCFAFRQPSQFTTLRDRPYTEFSMVFRTPPQRNISPTSTTTTAPTKYLVLTMLLRADIQRSEVCARLRSDDCITYKAYEDFFTGTDGFLQWNSNIDLQDLIPKRGQGVSYAIIADSNTMYVVIDQPNQVPSSLIQRIQRYITNYDDGQTISYLNKTSLPTRLITRYWQYHTTTLKPTTQMCKAYLESDKPRTSTIERFYAGDQDWKLDSSWSIIVYLIVLLLLAIFIVYAPRLFRTIGGLMTTSVAVASATMMNPSTTTTSTLNEPTNTNTNAYADAETDAHADVNTDDTTGQMKYAPMPILIKPEVARMIPLPGENILSRLNGTTHPTTKS